MILSPITIWRKLDLTQNLNAVAESETITAAGFFAQIVRFEGRLLANGERVKIYARFTKPRSEESVSALLLLPDANDDGKDLADYFAAKGYATLIPDYCGKRTKSLDEKNENSKGAAVSEAKKNYTEYPEAIAYANYEVSGAPACLQADSVEKSLWLEWAYVALYALEYLKTRNDVLRLGVLGVRLGGEIAWMTTLSPDISCVAAVNAVGWRSHLTTPKFGKKTVETPGEDSDSVRGFIAGVEAESYAPFIKCPVLMCCSMEDTFFDCDRAYDTFVRLGNPDGSAIVYSADSGECIGPNSLADIDLFLGLHLKGRHVHIPKPIELTATENNNGVLEITAKTDGDALVNTLTIYYAEGKSGQSSSRRAWQTLKRATGNEIKDNRVTAKCNPFSGAEYAFVYAAAEFVSGFKTVSPIVGKKLVKKRAESVKERVISAGDKDGFTVADYRNEAVGGIFLEKENMPEMVVGYGGISGVWSAAGVRTYRINSPRFAADDGSALKMDFYSGKDTAVKITVETNGNGSINEYSALIPISGRGKWKRVVLRAAELKDERTGKPLESFSRGIAIVIRSSGEDCPVPVANMLWL